MRKSALHAAIRQEMHRHDLPTFQHEKEKIVQPGCPACRKVVYTVNQFITHLTDDVLPSLLDRLSSKQNS